MLRKRRSDWAAVLMRWLRTIAVLALVTQLVLACGDTNSRSDKTRLPAVPWGDGSEYLCGMIRSGDPEALDAPIVVHLHQVRQTAGRPAQYTPVNQGLHRADVAFA